MNDIIEQFIELFESGGPVLIVILITSIFLWLLIIERYYYYFMVYPEKTITHHHSMGPTGQIIHHGMHYVFEMVYSLIFLSH